MAPAAAASAAAARATRSDGSSQGEEPSACVNDMPTRFRHTVEPNGETAPDDVSDELAAGEQVSGASRMKEATKARVPPTIAQKAGRLPRNGAAAANAKGEDQEGHPDGEGGEDPGDRQDRHRHPVLVVPPAGGAGPRACAAACVWGGRPQRHGHLRRVERLLNPGQAYARLTPPARGSARASACRRRTGGGRRSCRPGSSSDSGSPGRSPDTGRPVRPSAQHKRNLGVARVS